MKFFRILPETCASTWCLFSSSTLNMAFERLDHRRHHFNRVFFAHSLLISRLAEILRLTSLAQDFGSGLPLCLRPLDASTSIASSLLIDLQNQPSAFSYWLLASEPWFQPTAKSSTASKSPALVSSQRRNAQSARCSCRRASRPSIYRPILLFRDRPNSPSVRSLTPYLPDNRGPCPFLP